jgi:hypothetical protein
MMPIDVGALHREQIACSGVIAVPHAVQNMECLLESGTHLNPRQFPETKQIQVLRWLVMTKQIQSLAVLGCE